MKIRNVGPRAVHLVCVGRNVDLDEVVDVPDAVFEQFGWPEELWEVITPAPNKDEE